MTRYVIDIETNGFLEENLDYTKRPYRFKNTYKIWCISVKNIETDQITSLILDQCTKENLSNILHDATELCGHNIVLFDLPALKLLNIIDYTIGYPGKPSTVNGKECKITDTLILSRLLDPDLNDKYGKHSLDAWGKRLGEYKGDFHDFTQYSELMLDYNRQDVNVNKKIVLELNKRVQDLTKLGAKYKKAFEMETKIADLILKQSVLGFIFNKDQAKKNLDFLDAELKRIRELVNPLLPPKKPNKGELKFYEWPKNVFKKDGQVAANMFKFAEKIGGKVIVPFMSMKEPYLEFNNEKYAVKDKKPLNIKIPANIDDLNDLKYHLINLGWIPKEWKVRDLLKKPDKSKKTDEEITDTIERYITQSFDGVFAKERCRLLGVIPDPEELRKFLFKDIKKKKSLIVPTGPKVTIGLDKEICPNLEILGESASFVPELVKYLTYKHRRNAILGGELEFDEDDPDYAPDKGFLAYVRDEDGRIPTPALTNAASTSRMKHRITVNVPRVSSLFGSEMRSLFGIDSSKYFQFGMDFSSLEAVVTINYVSKYPNSSEMCESLLAKKPNDIHSKNGLKLGVTRDQGKQIFYASLYGCSFKKIAHMVNTTDVEGERIHNEFWESVKPLKLLKEKLEEYWEQKGKKYILGIDGRFLVSRSKHSLINLLFQAGGSLVAKWSLVRIAELLEELNLLGDPFEHSEEDNKIYQLIYMHDEIQYQVPKDIIDIKYFNIKEKPEDGWDCENRSKDEDKQYIDHCVKYGEETAKSILHNERKAKQYSKQNSGFSAVGHDQNHIYYVGCQNKLSECVDKGIQIAKKELNFRSALGFEWNIGSNWAECH